MRFLLSLIALILLFSCSSEKPIVVNHNFSAVEVSPFYNDSVSIRAVHIGDNQLMFAGSNGIYGTFDIDNEFNVKNKKISVLDFEGKKIQFRAIAQTKTDFFVLSIESPALLYKVNKQSREPKLVYKEDHDKVFYDSMVFWDNTDGIAMGDPTDGCLSVIRTKDGGETWSKVSCDVLPKTTEGEAAFAASNGNIKIIDDDVWMVSGGIKSRTFYSSDKGNTWSVSETPIIQGTETKGAYSLDFYDKNIGIIFGGDYTKPKTNQKNKAVTTDGGKTWNLIADGVGAGYKSCVRYVPNSGGKEIVGVGFTGISISNDSGNTWKDISTESFYTIRFINDSIAIAAGKNRMAKLIFGKQKSK
ncbi:oxidoreductase [uncultured Aquimarina sp.]|uniref:WD40/YVTN/BNR-like repeat-containing protein n=1 Tax=uncultured Aquimarina sp. TaxID=575652 RepID=UPI002615F975|nr:oxidoreductase [uncultured Aquimarina sp.]